MRSFFTPSMWTLARACRTKRAPDSEQEAWLTEFHLRKSCLHRPSQRRLAKFAVRASVLVLAVCAGVELGFRAQTLNAGPRELHQRDANRPGSAMRRTKTNHENYVFPAGYTLLRTTRIDGESYAMLAATEPSVATSGLGAGVAEVFDPNGRLIMRFQVSERPDSQWDVIEYVRVPVANGSAQLTGK